VNVGGEENHHASLKRLTQQLRKEKRKDGAGFKGKKRQLNNPVIEGAFCNNQRKKKEAGPESTTAIAFGRQAGEIPGQWESRRKNKSKSKKKEKRA